MEYTSIEMFTMPQFEHITITEQSNIAKEFMDKLVESRFIPNYSLGENIFWTKDGKLVNEAFFKDIDWDKMKRNAHDFAVNNADESKLVGEDRDKFIAIREKVHLRPASYIDKSGKYCSEDNMDSDIGNSLIKYAETWDHLLEIAKPDDILTNWTIVDYID